MLVRQIHDESTCKIRATISRSPVGLCLLIFLFSTFAVAHSSLYLTEHMAMLMPITGNEVMLSILSGTSDNVAIACRIVVSQVYITRHVVA